MSIFRRDWFTLQMFIYSGGKYEPYYIKKCRRVVSALYLHKGKWPGDRKRKSWRDLKRIVCKIRYPFIWSYSNAMHQKDVSVHLQWHLINITFTWIDKSPLRKVLHYIYIYCRSMPVNIDKARTFINALYEDYIMLNIFDHFHFGLPLELR